MFLKIAAALIAAYCSTFLYCITRNFFTARKTGFPSVIVPWDQNHFFWMVCSVPLRPHLQKWLPKPVYDRIVLTIYGWEFHERMRPYEEYFGPGRNDKSFMLVTCGKSEFWTYDAEITSEVLRRPRDFQQVDLTALFMARFGHNVLTSDGDRWARQRKVIASVINERISKAVFDESIRQTDGLLGEVYRGALNPGEAAESTHLFDMIKKITIHVLGGAGMGASVPWDDDVNVKPKSGFKMTYMEAVKTVIHNVTGPIILPQWFLSNYPSFLPGYQTLNSLSYAMQEFPTHTMDMLDQERQRSAASKDGKARSNIMSQLLQASESPGVDEKSKALSDEEMMGNLFIFTAAGFDTTANTLSYAVALLVRFPQWQDWLVEEIDSILMTEVTNEELEYTAIYPRCIRIMAFMMETLRLYTPLVHIPKQTRTPQTIQTTSGDYWLPANTTLYLNNVALGLDPEVWRNLNLSNEAEATEDDELRFRPTRWLNPLGSAQPLFSPPKGRFLPWSAGPRVCPGQKMAQVEFTAVILALLRRNRIEAVPLSGESTEQVNSRLDALMKDSISILTLQMNGVYDVDEDKGLRLRMCKRK
ncbi:hypothetical protein LTR36_006953 [Oleoguttula mirabilis]|uniref:Cytochrome P450 n=1 Tax=Oleoguttula mirabilis TaxID=1507867 RepID=A0AAV9JAX3_9PEZI|nr:hypothetical protein LTR36_006953 [Oleoguttula mirabilis]